MGKAIGGFMIGCGFSLLIGSLLVVDKVSTLNVKAVKQIIDKCPDKRYKNITLIGKANGEHHSTTIHCADGSIVSAKNSKYGE